MKKSFKFLMMFFVCLMAGSITLCSEVQGKDRRTTISTGERAQAIWDVQNVMSKHAYYKQVNQHCEELADIWVKENGPNDKTATWTSQFGVEVGIAQLKLNYCTACVDEMKEKLEEVNKVYPAIENTPENIGIGYMYFMHTNLLPVIEIAGDGKTAKGIWYSIGLNIVPDIASDGTATTRTNWAPEKYAVDFIKEDGKWKIWHFVNVFEPDSSMMMPGSSQEPETNMKPQQEMDMKPLGHRGVLPGEEPTGATGIVHYITRTADLYQWTPTTVPRIYPKFPEPYYTFSETFSY